MSGSMDDMYSTASQVMTELAKQVHDAVDTELLTLHQKAEAVDAKLRELEERADRAEGARLEAKVDEMRLERLTTPKKKKDLRAPNSIVIQKEDVREQDDINVEDDDLGLKAFAELHGLAYLAKRHYDEF